MRKLSVNLLKIVALPAMLLTFSALLEQALADVGPWVKGANSQARLLAAGAPDAGTYRAGIEIELKSGAHTYWRDPGDAGVPPRISFEGSGNLKSATLRFPAPSRIDEVGLTVYGFRNNLILPIEVVPLDASKPVQLSVQFTYAACQKICIPAELTGEMDLSPKAAPSAETRRLADAIALLPTPATAPSLGVTAKPIEQAGKIAWHVDLQRGFFDFFVEGPEGWSFDAKAEKSGFKLVADGKPQGWNGPVSVLLTLKGAADVEVTFDLPIP